MRTTLEIDDDVLQAAKEIAASQHSTAGKVISELVRRALEPKETAEVRNGILLLPRRGGPKKTMDLVNSLRDDE